MLSLSNDPILVYYENLLRETQAGSELPEFSEIYLRLSFKAILGKCYNICPEVLELHRKLLVLHYCQQYPSIKSVHHIMERCCSQNDISNILADEKLILTKWQEFKESEISNKSQASEMEINKRHTLLQIGNLNKKIKYQK